MCEVCGDFVRRRVVRGVWPSVAHSLESLAPGGLQAGLLYHHTATCKLQLKLLETVGILPELLQVVNLTPLPYSVALSLPSAPPSLPLSSLTPRLSLLNLTDQ